MTYTSMLPHKFDHYTKTSVVVNGGDDETPVIAHRNVKCFVQFGDSVITTNYKQRDSKSKASVYFIDDAVFNSIGTNDRIVFQGVNYRVDGTDDLCGLKKWYRLDLVEEIT